MFAPKIAITRTISVTRESRMLIFSDGGANVLQLPINEKGDVILSMEIVRDFFCDFIFRGISARIESTPEPNDHPGDPRVY
jgi:hypothetical protein